MKKVIVLLISIFLAGMYSQEFKWARAQFGIENPKGSRLYQEYHIEDWDIDLNADLHLLRELEKTTTLKPVLKVHTVRLDDLQEMTKYPLIFMHASDYGVFSDKEVGNLREYLKRGGMIYADDCNAGPEGDRFFRSINKLFEERVFPKKKFEELTEDSPIFHSHFEMPMGLPLIAGIKHPFMALKDDKGRVMVLNSSADLHCGWTGGGQATPLQIKQSLKMGVNIIIYAITN
ncbi:MAG: DUF4159 domain-containing protein [Candidatus Firestonebacteria bacterium]